VQQTVAIMGALSLGESVGSDETGELMGVGPGLSVAPLPYQMIPFFTLFSRLTIVAIMSVTIAYPSQSLGCELISQLPGRLHLDHLLRLHPSHRPSPQTQ
jgi:hypothetical protein